MALHAQPHTESHCETCLPTLNEFGEVEVGKGGEGSVGVKPVQAQLQSVPILKRDVVEVGDHVAHEGLLWRVAARLAECLAVANEAVPVHDLQCEIHVL